VQVTEVQGVPLRVWFTGDSFDPKHFDALYGLDAAQGLVDTMLWVRVDLLDELFIESNRMHSVNGFLFCNQVPPAPSSYPHLELTRIVRSVRSLGSACTLVSGCAGTVWPSATTSTCTPHTGTGTLCSPTALSAATSSR